MPAVMPDLYRTNAQDNASSPAYLGSRTTLKFLQFSKFAISPLMGSGMITLLQSGAAVTGVQLISAEAIILLEDDMMKEAYSNL